MSHSYRIHPVAATVTALVAGIGLAGCDSTTVEPELAIDAPDSALPGNFATAALEPVAGSSVSGTVTFAQLDDHMQIEAVVNGLPSGPHGLHLHENGDCSAVDASSAGGHFSPEEDPHGAPSDAPGQHHAGDLGNLTAGANGRGELEIEDPELTLVGEFGVVGKAVIVHAEADDLSSQPSGDAGSRIACGVIEWGSNLAAADDE